MPNGVHIRVTGANKAVRRLRSVSTQLVDLSSAYEQIGGYYRGQILAQFRGEGYYPGASSRWTPLQAETEGRKRRNKFSPLMESGSLRDSYVNKYDPFNISDVRSQKARFGSSHPTALFHQVGTSDTFANIHIPTRPVILGNDKLDDRIVREIAVHLFRWWRM